MPISIREDFPLLQQKIEGHPFIYFDSAATSLKPSCVTEAMSHFYDHEYGTVHRALYTLSIKATTRYSHVREQIARWLNASSADEIIFTKGTTESINLVASSFGAAFLHAGDEVIISEMEHHSNILPWRFICREKGAILKVIPIDERGELRLDIYEKILSPRTKLVSIIHLSNALGTINPLNKIIEQAHQKGAVVFVDGAQSAMHLPIDLQRLDADFFAFSGHKVFGPTGVGVLYGKKALLEKMPPYQGGGGMVKSVTSNEVIFQDPPLKFEAGTPPICEVIGLGRAVTYLESLGREKILDFERILLHKATEGLQKIQGIRILGTAAHKGPICTFVIEGVHPLDLATFLNLRGIAVRTGHLCAQPLLERLGVSAAMRISFAPYNTVEEIEIFLSSLKEICRMLS